jgi:hypothetical protein
MGVADANAEEERAIHPLGRQGDGVVAGRALRTQGIPPRGASGLRQGEEGMSARAWVVIFYALLFTGAFRLAVYDKQGWARVVGALLMLYGITMLYVAWRKG